LSCVAGGIGDLIQKPKTKNQKPKTKNQKPKTKSPKIETSPVLGGLYWVGSDSQPVIRRAQPL
jgi:hypothetical protein